MNSMPRNIQYAAAGFVAGFIAIFIATSNVILALVVGAVIFGLFYAGIIKTR